MPQAAGAAVAGWFFTVGTTAYAVTAAIVSAVITVGINYGLNKLQQSKAGKQKAGSVPAGRDITVRGTVEPMQIIYGEVRSPGFIVYYGASGDQNEVLHFVIAYAAHQCEDISDVWLDTRKVPDADIESDGEVTTTDFKDGGETMLYVHRRLGTKAQTAETGSGLHPWGAGGSTIPNWTLNHRGAGVAYVHYMLKKSEKVWPSGAPSNFFALVKGRRVYDPRKDSTNGGSGSHRYTDATTWEWSNNPTLCRRDYITGGSRWYDEATPEPRLGFGESNDRIDDEFTIASANIDDEDVDIPDGEGGETTQKRYTCDVQLSCGDTYSENLEILNSSAVGEVSIVGGKYRIYSGAYDTPDVDLVEDDIVGPMVVSTHPSGDNLYNFITGTFFDEDRDWSLSPFPNITNSSYETEDKGQYPRHIELHATRTSYRAQRIGMLHLAQSRNKITVRFERLSPKAMAITQHGTFTVTCSEYGWDEKVFRCEEWEWLPDGFVAITAREESSSAYTDPDPEDYADPDEATVETPQLDLPDTPLSLTVESRVQGVRLKWTVPDSASAQQIYHVYEHTSASPFSSATLIWSGNALSFERNLAHGTTRYYWVTAELNGQESEEYPVGDGTSGTPGTVDTDDVEEGAITTDRLEDEAATELAETSADQISGNSRDTTNYYILNTVESGGIPIQSAGSTTIFTGEMEFDCTAIVTANFKASASLGSVTVFPYLRNTGTSDVDLGPTYGFYTVGSTLAAGMVQGQFDLVAGQSYEIGVKKLASAINAEVWKEPISVNIEFIKK